MRGENFVAHLDGLGGIPVCRGTPVAHHCDKQMNQKRKKKTTFKSMFMYFGEKCGKYRPIH
jgi:hypothetical protein